ncbi:hypothetical protein [Bradyrhizobium sp. HKCCYLR1023]|uniref:hypothetical protein n=1 Tax=Bradyrhizobium TaxID=374 RepID=UPI003EBDA0FE
MRTAALLAIGSGALFPLLASGLSWFKTPDTSSQPTSVAELSFVGSQACSGCHQAETGLWQSSQHRHAMDHANDTSVRGDFNDTAFEYAGTRSRFFRKDRKFLVEKAHKADPNANREWEPEEWRFARENAPLEIKICLFLARYKTRTNDKFVNLPVLPELQAFMGELKVQRANRLIAVRDDGTVWPSEKEMQTRVSHWLRDRERAGHIGAGTTLHGPARVLRCLVEAQRRQHRRGGRSDRRRAGTHGRPLYPARRGRAEHHPSIQQDQRRSGQGVNGFCNRNGNARVRLENICRPGTKKLWKSIGRTWRNG